MRERLLVVKIGGARQVEPAVVCEDVALLRQEGFQVVVVHGGSARADQLAVQLGHPPRFLRSPAGYVSRYTDRRTRDIFVRAVRQVNAEIVGGLQRAGVRAVGLASRERCVVRGERKGALRAEVDGRLRVIRDDYSGRITDLRRQALEKTLARGQVPVLPPLALSPRDGFLNVDGDRVAAVVAGALGARWLLLLSNVAGLYRNADDPASLVDRVPRSQLDAALDWAQGRMKRKVRSVQEALALGVERAAVADGRAPHPLRRALAGGGTWFG